MLHVLSNVYKLYDSCNHVQHRTLFCFCCCCCSEIYYLFSAKPSLRFLLVVCTFRSLSQYFFKAAKALGRHVDLYSNSDNHHTHSNHYNHNDRYDEYNVFGNLHHTYNHRILQDNHDDPAVIIILQNMMIATTMFLLAIDFLIYEFMMLIDMIALSQTIIMIAMLLMIAVIKRQFPPSLWPVLKCSVFR